MSFTLHEQSFIAISAFFEIFLHITLIYIALPLIPSINLPILSAISPFVFVLLARIFLREKVAMNKYYGMVFGLLGVLCITLLPALFPRSGDVLGLSSDALVSLRLLGFHNTNLSSAQITWMGNGLLILGIIVGSVGPLFIKPLRHFPGQLITFWQFALVACITLPLALIESPDFFISRITLHGLFGLIYISVCSSVIAYSLYNNSLQTIKAADIGLLSYISPLSALLVGIPLLHEYPDQWFIMGSSLVLFGVWIAEKKTRKATVISRK